jgi:ribosome biogenesis GTPase
MLGKDELKTQEVSTIGDKGRHTTTTRELVLLPEGGVLIDTPGMRELQLWNGDNTLCNVFDDIEELAESCRFKDCCHKNEPGCAVAEAIRNGNLAQERLDSYRKLQKELKFMEQKQKNMERIRNKRSRGKDLNKAAADMEI